MQILHGLHHIRSFEKRSVVTIGNFDGVHLGHQQILERLCIRSMEYHLPAIVLTFEPHPEEFFLARSQIPARLTILREKIEIMQRYPIETLVILHFNAAFAQITAGKFIQQILFERLRTKHLVIGDDFHFGLNRLGNFAYLSDVGKQLDFTVESLVTISMHAFPDISQAKTIQKRISSTWIRQLLREGLLDEAKRLLGRPYSLCGRITDRDVMHDQFGVPTFIVHLHRKKSPIQGIYVVWVKWGSSEENFYGVARLNNHSNRSSTLDLYLFDFHESIKNQWINITFLHRLRDQRVFDSLRKLKKQIVQDIRAAKIYLNLMKK